MFEKDAETSSLIHLFASTSEHAYPALRDLINYVDTIKKLPSKISFDTLNEIFKITLNFADSDDDIISIYTKWLKFLLKFCDDPFNIDVVSILPEKIRNANEATARITGLLEENWSEPYSLSLDAYSGIISLTENTAALELLKFLNNENYEPEIPNNTKDTSLGSPEARQALQMLFEKYYYDGKTEKALKLLNHFPKNWKTFWNAHLCDVTSNEYLDALIFLFSKDKGLAEHQNVLLLQLELRMLVNEVEGKLGEEGYVDPKILQQISRELEKEFGNDVDPDSDEMVDRFTNKLYEKVVFNKARSIFSAIPKEIDKDHLVSIYVEIKKILEFCEEHEIEKTGPMMNAVNKVLFEEIKDIGSGVALISKMLSNNSHIKMKQYLLDLSYLMETNSVEMDTLFETLIKYISTQKLSPKQFKMYAEAFSEIQHPQFNILYELLISIHEDEKHFAQLAEAIVKSMNIFRSYSQTFYVILDAVFHGKTKVKGLQLFTSTLLKHDFDTPFARTLLHVLIDFFLEQPYMKLEKDFPKEGHNKGLLLRLIKLIDEFYYDAIEDESNERQIETKHHAMEKCKLFLVSIAPRNSNTTAAWRLNNAQESI